MSFPAHGTRRAVSIALFACALLVGAAETGGALAPPCAMAGSTITSATTKPVGDPDTPDEGGHKNGATSVGGASPSLAATRTQTAASPRFGFVEWLHALLGLFHQG